MFEAFHLASKIEARQLPFTKPRHLEHAPRRIATSSQFQRRPEHRKDQNGAASLKLFYKKGFAGSNPFPPKFIIHTYIPLL